MPIFRLASYENQTAYVEVDATENADGSLVVSTALWQNLTSKPFTFNVRRATGVSVVSRTVNPGQTVTSTSVPGNAANRTIVSCQTVWG